MSQLAIMWLVLILIAFIVIEWKDPIDPYQ